MSAEEWVRKANRRLKGCGVTLEVSGKNNNLSIRGMIPGKPWEDPTIRQRRISLKMRALTLEDVKKAEVFARQVGLDLNRGEFDWREFTDIDDPTQKPVTIGEWVKELEREKRLKVNEYTWKYSYQTLIERLPMDKEPTEDLLMAWILEHDPDASTMRRKYLSIAKSICQLAGIQHKKLDRLAKENQSKPVNPRFLPSDQEIEEMALSIEHKEWRWVYSMLAVYGLRPHELFRLDFKRFPDLRVLPETKTGERLVPPIYPRWVDLFALDGSIHLPSNLQWNEDDPNWRLGRKIGNGFTRHKLGDAYNLRHCYARRCLERGLTSDVSAALMGHSRQIHESRYRAFLTSNTYLEVAKRITALEQ